MSHKQFRTNLKFVERVDIRVFGVDLHHHRDVGVAFLEFFEQLPELLIRRDLHERIVHKMNVFLSYKTSPHTKTH